MERLKHITSGLLFAGLALFGPASGFAAPAVPPLAATMTDPAPNARVDAPLPLVHVMFNGPVDPKASGFEITRSDGAHVDVQEVAPMGDSILMVTPKAPLTAGNYRVKWHAAGSDKKTLEGEFSFTVQ